MNGNICQCCKKIFGGRKRKFCGSHCREWSASGRLPDWFATRKPWVPRKEHEFTVAQKSCKRCGEIFTGLSKFRNCERCRQEPLYTPKPRRYPNCFFCEGSLAGEHPNTKFCKKCRANPRKAYSMAAKLKDNNNEQARMLTKYAVKVGFLPHPRDFKCVDCKKCKAECYDHRDYSKPLEVDPVCLRCNASRGKGKVVYFPCKEYVAA